MSVWPSSTPTVVTVTVPSELSSVAFKRSPQLKALVAIALILGTVLSFKETVLLPCVVVSAVALFSKKMAPAAVKQ